MSSGESDGYIPDESLPSYDGYKMSSEEEEEEESSALIYPADDTVFHDDVLGELNSEASFSTDKFPDVLTLPPSIGVMGGILEALNTKVLDICEESRQLVNQLYRANRVLKSYGYLGTAWELKQCTDGSSVTPEPDGAAPDFCNVCCDQIADIGMIIDALKKEEFAIAQGLDHGQENLVLLADFNSLSLKCQQYWKSSFEDLLPGSTTKDITAGLYADLLGMEHMIKRKISTIESSGRSCCKFPFLLQNALKCFKEEKLD